MTSHATENLDSPLLALTMGDVSGIGPEVIVRAIANDQIHNWCQPIVIGHPAIIQRAIDLIGANWEVASIESISDATIDSPTTEDKPTIICWNPIDDAVVDVEPGTVDSRAGHAAYEYLVAAAKAAVDGKIDAITTAPLNKASLNAAGLNYPGHTEILAEVCGVDDFAMMLYLPRNEVVQSPHGLGVAHVTLHTSIQSVPDLLTTNAIREKIGLIHQFLGDVGCNQPRVAVCALNPHAGESGLFGDEENRIIRPAVEDAHHQGIDVTGPLPADTLLKRAVSGEFDAVVAMYHDQGHIALKLIGFDQAVNVTLGLPIVRTSPSHGTAFDIAWQGSADETGMIGAMRIAARLAKKKRTTIPQ